MVQEIQIHASVCLIKQFKMRVIMNSLTLKAKVLVHNCPCHPTAALNTIHVIHTESFSGIKKRYFNLINILTLSVESIYMVLTSSRLYLDLVHIQSLTTNLATGFLDFIQSSSKEFLTELGVNFQIKSRSRYESQPNSGQSLDELQIQLKSR